jgi:hypothetical protein
LYQEDARRDEEHPVWAVGVRVFQQLREFIHKVIWGALGSSHSNIQDFRPGDRCKPFGGVRVLWALKIEGGNWMKIVEYGKLTQVEGFCIV